MESSIRVSKNDFVDVTGRFDFLLKHYKQGNVLDIGNVGGLYGGEGNNFSSYLSFVEKAAESTVYGFDLFDPINDAEHYKNQTTGNLEDGLPYEDAFFDTVYMGEIFEHVHNPGNLLRECHRVLKTEGVLILDTPNAYDLKRLIKWCFQREENLGDPTHLIFFTPASLKSILIHNGFSVEVMAEKRPQSFLRKVLGCGLGSHLLYKAVKSNH